MKLLIKNGRVVDPSQNMDMITDVLVEDGKIAQIGTDIKANDAHVINATGKVITPGFIDMHVHLREPGLEAKEDLVSGTQAAAAGGFTTIACMPNTKPVIDNSIVVSGLKERIAREALVKVEIVGAISKGQEGKELAEMGDMAFNGALAFSDDGKFVENAKLFSSALEYASIFDKIIISHAEDPEMSDGYMHEGAISARLGIPGMPSVSEDIAVSRDILLAEYCKAKLHVAHVSSAGSVDIIRQAKKRGVAVTAEVTVQHLTLTDDAVIGFNTAAKVCPPLRDDRHVQALRQGVLDGTFDMIVTDHAPHAFEEKDVEFRYAPNGFCGLETSVGVVLTELYHTGILTLTDIVRLMSVNPAQVFELPVGTLKVGSPADITVLDLEHAWQVQSDKFYTRGKHTPYEGKTCRGAAVMTIVNGKIVMKEGVVC